MKNKFDHKVLQKCLLQIEEKLGWGSSEQWHNEVFSELSERIQEETDVVLSSTTLKRVWGRVNYKGSPSISTLNALSQFLDYANWRDFKNQTDLEPPSKKLAPSSSNHGLLLATASFLAILFISLFSVIGSDGDQVVKPDYSKLKFSSHPITQGLPNSVVFDLDLKKVKAKDILIQQYWDATKTIEINAEQRQATGIYYYPGYFRAKLLIDQQIIKEHDLFIKTEGWLATIDYEPIPKYITPVQSDTAQLSFPTEILEEIASIEASTVSSFHLVDEFPSTSSEDNFTLQTSIKNAYRDKWAVCQEIKIVFLGSEGAMIIPFSIPGCVSNLGVMLNDTYLSGKEQDLSAFGVDFSEFRKIGVQVKNKEVFVSVDEQEVFKGRYEESMGRLVGIRFRFRGAGELRDLEILDGEGLLLL